jgi:hypothetical protein
MKVSYFSPEPNFVMMYKLIALMAFLCVFCVAHAQSRIISSAARTVSDTLTLSPRPAGEHGKDPNSFTPSGMPYRVREDLPKGGTVYRMDSEPTFQDHSLEAIALESELPVRIPVVPFYNVSQSLPGYLDATRRISIIMMDDLLPSIPLGFDDSAEMIASQTEGKLMRSGFDERLKFLYQQSHAWPEQEGRGEELVWEYTNEGETWVRHEVILGNWEEEGFHYVTLAVFYPVQFKDRVRPEMDYYMDHLIINDFQR